MELNKNCEERAEYRRDAQVLEEDGRSDAQVLEEDEEDQKRNLQLHPSNETLKGGEDIITRILVITIFLNIMKHQRKFNNLNDTQYDH